MNTTMKLAAATLAAASATWSFTTGNFGPGILAVLAGGLTVLDVIGTREK